MGLPSGHEVRKDTPVEAEVAETQQEETEDSMEVDEAGEEMLSEPIDIPPERRSTCKPKPTKVFGDMVGWTEAQLHIKAASGQAP